MEKNRKQLSEQDINEMINQLSRTGKYGEELLRLVRSDLEYGLSREEVDIYLTKKLPIDVKQSLSMAMREGIPVELVSLFAGEALNTHQIETAIGFYKDGADFELIKMVVEQKLNAHGMKEVYKKIREKVVVQKPEKTESAVSEKELEELYQKLSDRDALISSQQDNINRMNSTLLKLNKEKEQMEGDRKLLQESVDRLTKQLEERERQVKKEEGSEPEQEEESDVPEAEKSDDAVEPPFPGVVKLTDDSGKSVYGIPIQYVITGQKVSGEVMQELSVEKTPKKRPGFFDLLLSLVTKKKSHRDIVRLVSSGNLSTEQLVQIRVGMEKHLTEEQLLSLINNDVPAEQMKEIIEIAVLENGM